MNKNCHLKSALLKNISLQGAWSKKFKEWLKEVYKLEEQAKCNLVGKIGKSKIKLTK